MNSVIPPHLDEDYIISSIFWIIISMELKNFNDKFDVITKYIMVFVLGMATESHWILILKKKAINNF